MAQPATLSIRLPEVFWLLFRQPAFLFKVTKLWRTRKKYINQTKLVIHQNKDESYIPKDEYMAGILSLRKMLILR